MSNINALDAFGFVSNMMVDLSEVLHCDLEKVKVTVADEAGLSLEVKLTLEECRKLEYDSNFHDFCKENGCSGMIVFSTPGFVEFSVGALRVL